MSTQITTSHVDACGTPEASEISDPPVLPSPLPHALVCVLVLVLALALSLFAAHASTSSRCPPSSSPPADAFRSFPGIYPPSAASMVVVCRPAVEWFLTPTTAVLYGHLVRCDIPAPRSASSRLFAFVEYEDRRDADDAYHEMHNKRIGRDDILKIEWARTPPSASWRFDSGRDRERAPRRSSPRRGRSPSPRRSTRDYSPRKDDRRDRDRDYDRDRRDTRDRSRSPDRRDRDGKDDRDDRDHRENAANGDDRKAIDSPPPAHDDLDVAE
ncbi:Pre-mRNA-splicing factor srp1 [Colletotrichum spinosum]|uniref:Pre-mRNA-splicing factor srp1 n=1 Tax=Colletotrichum spinosum TaxID=1347390 RepID=A0A4R8PSJ0_9PEZI|nr:Pre-mRNA-splicing factor srp1 [Colletotrichum spinosum]